MAITVVSTLPPTSATATTESAAPETAAPGEGFADLLLGKLLPTGDGTSATAAIATLVKTNSKPSSDPATELTQPTDPALLLAAMVAAQPAQNSPQVAPPTQPESTSAISGQTAAPGTGTPITSTGQEKAAATPGNDETAENSIGDPRTLPSTANGQNTAKFAVAGDEFGQAAAKAEGAGDKASRAANADMAAGVAAAPAQAHSVQHARGEAALSVPTAVRDANWNTDFSQKVVWLANSQTQSAELTLNPPSMGSIEISLKLTNDTATATFTSANAEVREAIETALPRLREMFASAGIELGQTNVSAESFKQASGQGFSENGASQGRGDNAILVPDSGGREASGRVAIRQSLGLVDTFV